MILERLSRLRREMEQRRIDVYVVPTADFHESEYVGAHFKARSYITGFTGSAGLWTDARYFLQAKHQLENTGVTLYRMGEEGVPTIMEYLRSALPEGGTVFVSVCDRDKRAIVPIARDIARLGFRIVATGGTARTLRAAGVECEQVRKIHEGEGNVRDMIAAGDISLMINTPFGHATRADGYELRLEAVKHGVTHVTNLAGAQAMVAGMEAARLGGLAAVALQDLPQWELSR